MLLLLFHFMCKDKTSRNIILQNNLKQKGLLKGNICIFIIFRSILPGGPVGLNGILKSGDELLEVRIG